MTGRAAPVWYAGMTAQPPEAAWMDTLHPPPQVLAVIGQWRRFGEIGPVYEVTGIGPRAADGTWTVQIRLPESGEESAYRLDRLLADPLAD